MQLTDASNFTASKMIIHVSESSVAGESGGWGKIFRQVWVGEGKEVGYLLTGVVGNLCKWLFVAGLYFDGICVLPKW